ncbi:MAG: helix-turn-helix domain-containing protein [Calditrichia bacterium]
MLMHKSRGKRFIGDSIAYYETGDLFFIGPNLPHTWYAPTENAGQDKLHQAILIQFPENLAGLNIGEVPELKSLQKLFRKAALGLQIHGSIRAQAAELMKEMSTLSGLDRLLALFKLLQMLSDANPGDLSIVSSVEFTRKFQPDEQSRIDRVCTFINENYRRKLRLEDAAEIANMSATAFSRFFKRSTGKTFINYVNDLRIGRACKLLIDSELSVGEICYEVGFNNLSNFNRRFCERHGCTPRAYRMEFTIRFDGQS